jgi:hypothetical protein
MNEDLVTQLTPSEEDPIVDRWLASLPEFAPRAGFDDAVMRRVYVPVPLWLQTVQSGTRRLFKGNRAWAWAGGLAASSAVSMVVLVSWALSHWVQVETAWSLFVNSYAVDAWRATITLAVKVFGTGLAVRDAWGLNGTLLISAGIAAVLITAFSAWGLHRILSSTNTERISFNASR